VIENAFLDTIANYLNTQANLTPAPAAVGVVEPAGVAGTPAIVLGLQNSKRLGNGLGERSAVITGGALPWTATIDLANPVLPTDPSFQLLSNDRKQLILPHGGLVRSDGTQGSLATPDLVITIDGASIPVVAAAPVGQQVAADPTIGILFFGTALPANGTLIANYFLGQWEQRVQQMSGVLRVAVTAVDPVTVRDLSNAVLGVLEAPPIAGLRDMQLTELQPVRPPDPNAENIRTRVALFSFQFEFEINQPESSGGIILKVPVNSNVG
jgi:hypothetical protein